MVSLDDLGLEVKVLVNGSPAIEYPDEDPGAVGDDYDEAIPRSYKYIESTDDAEFSILVGARPGAVDHWLTNGVRHALRFHIDIDGLKSVARGTVTRDGSYDIVTGLKDYSGKMVSLRGFRFASVSTVDDAGQHQVAKDAKRAQNLGVIRVCAYHDVYEHYDSPASHRSEGLATLERQGKVSIAEKALKGRAVSHGAVLSTPVQTYKKKNTTSRKYYHVTPQTPKAVFCFKYRSREALKQELIIPRSRSVSVGSEVDKLPEDEVRRLARAYLAQNQGNKKRAASVKDEPDAVPRSKRPLKVLKTEKGKKVTIDLTEDD